ncbi:MAG: tetratricopeptide repeat protein [Desulfobacterales bacterium]
MAALLGQMAEAAADIRSHVRLAPFIPHAQELARDAEDPISLDLAGWLGTFYHEAGLYQTAREWNEAASHRQMALLDEEHPDTLFSMNNLALTLRAQGDIAGARSLQEKVLKARRRLLGEKHPDTSASAWSLLMTLAELGDTSAALALLKSDLLWLLERHPNELGGTQRNIRKLLADGLKTG